MQRDASLSAGQWRVPSLDHSVQQKRRAPGLRAEWPPLLQVAHDAEAVCVVAHVGVVAKARRRAHVARLAVERAAAQHALSALAGRPRGTVLWGAAIIVVPAILDPLGSIAGSVEQPERIGRKTSGGDRLLPGIAAALAAIGKAAADVAPPPIGRLGAGARRIFPFRLAGQAIFL